MPSEKPLAKRRRLAAQRVREARERLTSTTGTRVAFDYELLRQFAENRLSASLVILLLVGTVGFLSSVWTGAMVAGAWTAAVLVIHAVIVTKCRQFLSEPSTTQDRKRWRLRFIILDLFYGLAWMYNLIHPVGQDEGSSTFMLFVMLLVVAVSSMLASSLPIAVFAATVPVTFAVALNFALQGDLHNYILGIMAIAAQGYFTRAGAASALVLIANTMTTLIGEQRREIGMMKAIGGTRRQIRRIYLRTALLLGAAGSVIGVALGLWSRTRSSASSAPASSPSRPASRSRAGRSWRAWSSGCSRRRWRRCRRSAAAHGSRFARASRRCPRSQGGQAALDRALRRLSLPAADGADRHPQRHPPRRRSLTTVAQIALAVGTLLAVLALDRQRHRRRLMTSGTRRAGTSRLEHRGRHRSSTRAPTR